jgi:hypothetical protein
VNRQPYPAVHRAIRQLLRHYPQDTAAAALWAVSATPVSLADALRSASTAAATAPRELADFVFDAHPDLLGLDAHLDRYYPGDQP